MISLSVINVKDIIKYLVKVAVIMIFIVTLTKYFFSEKDKEIIKKNNFLLKGCISQTFSIFEESSLNEEDDEEVLFKKNIYESFLNFEIKAFSNILVEKEEEKNEKVEEKIENQEEIQLAEEKLQTVVQDSGITPKFTNNYKGVQIKNETRNSFK